jgi:hypothetical protein
MKKFLEWWHGYRMLVHILKGVRSLLKVAKYNYDLNLASAPRQYEWAVGAYPYTNVGPFSWLLRRQFKKTRALVTTFDFAGHNFEDGWTYAMKLSNDIDHANLLPQVERALTVLDELSEFAESDKELADYAGEEKVDG